MPADIFWGIKIKSSRINKQVANACTTVIPQVGLTPWVSQKNKTRPQGCHYSLSLPPSPLNCQW